MLHYEVYSHHVVNSSGDDHICILLCRQAELLEGGLHERGVLREDLLQVPPALHISQNSAGQPHVGVRVHKEPQVEHVADVLVVEHQDALEQHHVGRVHHGGVGHSAGSGAAELRGSAPPRAAAPNPAYLEWVTKS